MKLGPASPLDGIEEVTNRPFISKSMKTPLDPDGDLWRLPDTNILLNMNQRDLARTLNYSWRHFKKYQDRYKRWKKRQERFERTLEKHRQEYEEKKIQKILKRKERKVKIKARDITWISY